MVSKGQFVGLDWNRITRLHSQVMTGTHEHFIYHVFVVSSLYTHFGGWLAASLICFSVTA